jgi:hypothetical protein
MADEPEPAVRRQPAVWRVPFDLWGQLQHAEDDGPYLQYELEHFCIEMDVTANLHQAVRELVAGSTQARNRNTSIPTTSVMEVTAGPTSVLSR